MLPGISVFAEWAIYSWNSANRSPARVSNEAIGIVDGRRPARRKLVAAIAKALIAHISIVGKAACGENHGALLHHELRGAPTRHVRNARTRLRREQLRRKPHDDVRHMHCRGRPSHSILLILTSLMQTIETSDRDGN